MPALAESERQPDKNLTFTQFFTKLLIKIPQVDIEKLPAHLLKDISYLDIPCQGQTDDEEQYKDEKEDDIYSLEHEENIEEFKTKEIPEKFMKSGKVKNFQSEDSNRLNMILTEPEDEDKDSVTCTVEESELNCPEEEMLDLTITDEFTEECGRETVLSDPIEDQQEICMADIITSEEGDKMGDSKEKCLRKGSFASPDEFVLQPLADSTDVCDKNDNSNSEDVNDLGIFQANDILANQAEDTNEADTLQKINEMKEEEDIKTNIELSKSDAVPDLILESNFVNKSSQLEKSDSDRIVVTETCVGPKGGNNTDNITTDKLKHVEEQTDTEPDTVSSEIDQEHFRSTELKSPVIESNKCSNETSEYDKNNIESEDQPVSSLKCDDEIQEVNQEIEMICDSPVKERGQVEEMNEMNKILKGNLGKTKLECAKHADKKFAKGFNIDEDLEPPALKIRIFKGHSGELINEKEAKRTKKRKKKTEKQKAKLAKLSLQKAEEVKLITIVEKNTQNRISQELPGCNWLEQKIKSGERSQNVPRPTFQQLDALLETDSDDDYLIVDDRDESCEVTSNFKEGKEENDNDDNTTKTRSENQESSQCSDQHNEQCLDPDFLDPMASGKALQDFDDKSAVIEDKSDNEVLGSHPFTYMLGNLMKKMDNKHTDTDTNQVKSRKSNHDETAEENRKIKENSIVNMNEKEIQNKENVRKPKEIKEIPHFKIQAEQTEHQQPIEEANAKICDHNSKKFKPNPVNKPDQNVITQQPKNLAMHLNQRTIDKERHESYEKTIEESRVARQNAQNLFFQQQFMEKKRIEDQLIKDIEDLKNKKIKEMEDLIEIKTKKEQTMTDLEKLKSEIVKNKTFLESLKKINLREETQVISPSAAQFEEVKHIDNKNPTNLVQQFQNNTTKSPEPHYRPPQTQEILENGLPDLVNHEKTVFNENNVHSKVPPEHLRHLNLSQEYLKHLQRIQENGKVSQEHPKYPERTPPLPQLYNKQVQVNQSKDVTIPENQINHQAYTPNNVRPPPLPNNIQVNNQQQQVPMLLPNVATKLNKYGTNIQDFFPGLANEKNPNETNSQALQKQSFIPVSVSKVQSDEQRRQPEARGNVVEGSTVPNKVVVEGFIRPRAFSREENINSPTELSKFMNDMNSQYAVRNIPNIISQQRSLQPNQTRQEIPDNRNFPEIRNAIAASTDRRNPQPQGGTPTPTFPQSTQQKEPMSILSKCAVCSKVANFLCSGCQKVYYCTVQCQSNHWLSHYSKCAAARS